VLSFTNFLVRILSGVFSKKGYFPKEVCYLIAKFTVDPPAGITWGNHGKTVAVNGDTAVLLSQESGSAIANKSFSSGIHRWCIHVDNGHQYGCRYLGVVNSTNIILNNNLQNGASSHRVAWDGSCSSIYFDINGYKSIPVGAWTTGNSVQVEADCVNKKISFFLDGKLKHAVDVSELGPQVWTPVVGFGSTKGQSVTICSCVKY